MFPNRERPEGEGCEVSAPTQAPPTRASPLEPAGETSAAWGWGPYLECWGGGGARVDPPHTLLLAWGPGGLSCLEQPGVLHAKGEGQHCRQAPPPASGVAAGPASQAGRGRGRSFLLWQK